MTRKAIRVKKKAEQVKVVNDTEWGTEMVNAQRSI